MLFLNTRLAVIIFFIMLILCAAILIVFKQYMNNNIAGSAGMINPEADGNAYYVQNVLDLSAWLGKTAAETGIDEKYIKGDYDSLNVAFNGMLFDKNAYGTFYFSYDHTDPDALSTVNDIYIHTKEMDYEEAKAKLTEVYGSCYDEFEEPYVEVNGGAVTRCYFNGEGFTIKLASASERDYIDVIISKNKEE